MTRLPRLAAVLFLVAAGVALHADPAADFRKAVYQYDRARTPNDLQAVVALLRNAIAANGVDSSPKTIRTEQTSVFLSYRPHAYLAAALARLGRCEDARKEWEASRKQAGEGNLEAKVLKEARDTCPKPPLVAVVDTATQPVTSTTHAVVPPPPPPTGEPDLTGLQRTLKTAMEDAQRLLDSSPNGLLTPRARRAQEALAAARWAEASSPSRTEETLRRAISTLTELTKTCDTALSNLPPQPLADAITAYVKGDYAGALRLLPQNNVRPPYDAQVALLRAAARYMQAAARGDSNPERLVRNDLVAYKRIAPPAASLDAHLFSPRFRTILAEVH